jgi:MarR family transcriptional regulator, transcriptional regulator for hemolysin
MVAIITSLIIARVTQSPDFLFLLHDVARLIRHEADRRAAAHEMTRAQWVILIWLQKQPGLSQKELAEIIEVEPITIARLIDRLEARGMVERRPDPKDRRIWRLHLMPPADPVLAELEGERADILRLLTEDMPAATQQTMIAGLQQMKATLLRKCRHKAPMKDATIKDVA